MSLPSWLSWMKRPRESASLRGVFTCRACYDDEASVIKNHQSLLRDVKGYTDQNELYLIRHCLQILMAKKTYADGTYKLRKDNETPDYIHELRQIVAGISLIENGLMPKQDPRIFRAEMLLCASAVHDLGEDFGMFAEGLVKKLQSLMTPELRKFYESMEEDPDHLIHHIAEIMEIMTFERKFSIADTEKMLSDARINATIPPLVPDEKKREITGAASDFFLEKMNFVPSAHPEQMSVYLKRIEKPGKPPQEKIVVSRYNSQLNAYMAGLMTIPHALLAKFIDRTEGVSTRIGLDEGLVPYTTYLEQTESLFFLNNLVDLAKNSYPGLENAFDSAFGELNINYTIARFFSDHYPVARGKELGVDSMPIPNIAKGLAAAEKSYGSLPSGLRPFSILMGRVARRAEEKTDLSVSHMAETLFDRVCKALTPRQVKKLCPPAPTPGPS